MKNIMNYVTLFFLTWCSFYVHKSFCLSFAPSPSDMVDFEIRTPTADGQYISEEYVPMIDDQRVVYVKKHHAPRTTMNTQFPMGYVSNG